MRAWSRLAIAGLWPLWSIPCRRSAWSRSNRAQQLGVARCQVAVVAPSPLRSQRTGTAGQPRKPTRSSSRSKLSEVAVTAVTPAISSCFSACSRWLARARQHAAPVTIEVRVAPGARPAYPYSSAHSSEALGCVRRLGFDPGGLNHSPIRLPRRTGARHRDDGGQQSGGPQRGTQCHGRRPGDRVDLSANVKRD